MLCSCNQAAPAAPSGAEDDADELTAPALPDSSGESNVTAAANKAVAAGLVCLFTCNLAESCGHQRCLLVLS